MRRSTCGTAALAALVVTSFASAGSIIQISEIRIDQPSTDNDEYFELAGPASASLDGLTYLVIGDGSAALGSGVIEAVVPLTGEAIRATGFFVAAETTFTLGVANLTANLNFENNDNVTHLLVSGFTGASGDDLDTNDDGVLDVQPWTAILDAVGLIVEPNPPSSTEYSYGESLGFEDVGPDDTFVPGHVYRCSTLGCWTIGPFDPAIGDDTPGAPNTDCAPPPTDLDGSGDVGFADLLILLSEWGPCPPSPCNADFDATSSVGFSDLLILLGEWGFWHVSCPV